MATETEHEVFVRETNSEEYNGWTNRETWAVNLWLSNDQGIDELVRERVEEAVKAGKASFDRDMSDTRLVAPVRVYAADAIKDFVDELLDPEESLMSDRLRQSMASDCGSLWRVDWFEIADAFSEPDTREQ